MFINPNMFALSALADKSVDAWRGINFTYDGASVTMVAANQVSQCIVMLPYQIPNPWKPFTLPLDGWDAIKGMLKADSQAVEIEPPDANYNITARVVGKDGDPIEVSIPRSNLHFRPHLEPTEESRDDVSFWVDAKELAKGLLTFDKMFRNGEHGTPVCLRLSKESHYLHVTPADYAFEGKAVLLIPTVSEQPGMPPKRTAGEQADAFAELEEAGL